MKSLVAALGAASLLAFAVSAPAQPADTHVPHAAAHRCDPAAQVGRITLCNPLGHSRGVGAGLGRL
jgi:hypothetical protein